MSTGLKGLVMTRKPGDIVRINGGELKIGIVSVKGKYVRLVFQCAKDIRIDRDEHPDALPSPQEGVLQNKK